MPAKDKVVNARVVKTLWRRPLDGRLSPKLNVSRRKVWHVVEDAFSDRVLKTENLKYQTFDNEGKRVSPDDRRVGMWAHVVRVGESDP